jgi:hypothetical protein
MPKDDTAQQQNLVNDPDAQLLLDQLVRRMGGLTPVDALRRSLQTVLAMYDAQTQGGEPMIQYRRNKTQQQILLPGPGAR